MTPAPTNHSRAEAASIGWLPNRPERQAALPSARPAITAVTTAMTEGTSCPNPRAKSLVQTTCAPRLPRPERKKTANAANRGDPFPFGPSDLEAARSMFDTWVTQTERANYHFTDSR